MRQEEPKFDAALNAMQKVGAVIIRDRKIMVVRKKDQPHAGCRPSQALGAAQRIAAEHHAFSDEAHNGLRGIPEIARALVNNPFWDFWWD